MCKVCKCHLLSVALYVTFQPRPPQYLSNPPPLLLFFYKRFSLAN